MTDSKHYPTRDERVQAWEELARGIYEERDQLTHDIAPEEKANVKEGSLTIIGSGIRSIGFTMDAERTILDADKVFFCVADPPTIVWIRKLRPDAFDLYTLYDDTKVRYYTYMQMTEAMLYYMRKGMKVVGVYYGHPGIFVLSTHRAIAIAKREGYRAEMQPGISALDCLCADLGVDPAYPGMQTFEATDMMMRGRKPDVTSHLVLWQVGLIGEMGYRRQGFINKNFDYLVEYLQGFYGDDFAVTNYIASRYPTIPPLIEKYKLKELKDPRIRTRVTGLSTFYLPPLKAKKMDVNMAIKMGLAKPEQKMRKPTALRVIDQYGKREKLAIENLQNFNVPEDYQYQECTRASEFLIELSQNNELQRLYQSDPEKAVSEEVFPGLSETEKTKLISRAEGALQIVSKGNQVVNVAQNEQFVMQLYNSLGMVKELRGVLRQFGKSPELEDRLADWSNGLGFEVTWPYIPRAIQNVNSVMLLPWTGLYREENGQVSILLKGGPKSNRSSLVYLNGSRILNYTYRNQLLIWKQSEGNPNNGWLNVCRFQDENKRWCKKMEGVLWQDGADEDEKYPFSATEVPFVSAKANNGDPTGSYIVKYFDQSWKQLSSFELGKEGLLIDGVEQTTTKDIHWEKGQGEFPAGDLSLMTDPITGQHVVAGKINNWKSYGIQYPGNLLQSNGTEKISFHSTSLGLLGTQIPNGPKVELIRNAGGFSVELTDTQGRRVRINNTRFRGERGVLKWSEPIHESGLEAYSNAEINLLPIDRLANYATFRGKCWAMDGTAPERENWKGWWASIDQRKALKGYPAEITDTLNCICAEHVPYGGNMFYQQWAKVTKTGLFLDNVLMLIPSIITKYK